VPPKASRTARTRRVLEHKARRQIDWNRITEEQIAQRGLTPILKTDHRFTTEPGRAREFEAWECEALGQGTIQRLVRDALDGLLTEPLSDVLEREAEQRARVAAVLDELDE
jgi:hypothetical protein